jgi:hypothetical protein
MLQVIITATLFITGLLATEKHVNQTSDPLVEVCLETNGEVYKTKFDGKHTTHLLEKHTNLKNENERETI